MDSKYNAVGGENGLKNINLKRKAPDKCGNLKVKQLKLTTEDQSKINGHGLQNRKTEPPTPKKTIEENLQESRKKLPVYNVRNRSVNIFV